MLRKTETNIMFSCVSVNGFAVRRVETATDTQVGLLSLLHFRKHNALSHVLYAAEVQTLLRTNP